MSANMGHRLFKLARMIFIAVVLPGSAGALAHDLPINTVMNAFFAVEPHEAHLIIRIPLDLLRSVSFPLRGGEYDLERAGPAMRATLDALKRDIAIREDGTRLIASAAEGRLSLPSDRSFEDYEQAVAHVLKPMEADVPISYEQGFFDARLSYPIQSPQSVFTLQTAIAADLPGIAKTVIRYLPPGEPARALIVPSGSGSVALNPTWYEAALSFVVMGIEHILSGTDHLLFLLCLVIPFRQLRGVLIVITAFTVAHSVTLIGSAFNMAPAGAWFPPFVETVIAASIVYMALENIVGADLHRRWLLAALFGLVHGFGFSFALRQTLQFAGSHLLTSLLAFNVGIEIGQILVLVVIVPALAILLRGRLSGRIGIILLSAIVAHTGWHWMTERADVLWQTPWPGLDGDALKTLARWAAGLLVAGAVARFLVERIERPAPSS